MESPRLIAMVVLIVLVTLALVLVSVIGVLLAGLFNSAVDNRQIFAVLGPAFQTIVGCFVGVLGSVAVYFSQRPK